MPRNELVKYYPEVMVNELPPRSIGVQVVILDQEGRAFIRPDTDGGRIEGHINTRGTIFPNTRTERINSVSGGMKYEDKSPADTSLREMRKELNDPNLGEGTLGLLTGIPLVSFYQEKNGTSSIMAGYFVVYIATPQEVTRLNEIGEFMDIKKLQADMTEDDRYRPAFRFAVDLLCSDLDAQGITDMVQSYNHTMVTAAIAHVQENSLELNPGIFTSLITTPV